jgi:hypothetical protein
LRGNYAADHGRSAESEQSPAQDRAPAATAMIIITMIITALRTMAAPIPTLLGVRW